MPGTARTLNIPPSASTLRRAIDSPRPNHKPVKVFPSYPKGLNISSAAPGGNYPQRSATSMSTRSPCAWASDLTLLPTWVNMNALCSRFTIAANKCIVVSLDPKQWVNLRHIQHATFGLGIQRRGLSRMFDKRSQRKRVALPGGIAGLYFLERLVNQDFYGGQAAFQYRPRGDRHRQASLAHKAEFRYGICAGVIQPPIERAKFVNGKRCSRSTARSVIN